MPKRYQTMMTTTQHLFRLKDGYFRKTLSLYFDVVIINIQNSAHNNVLTLFR